MVGSLSNFLGECLCAVRSYYKSTRVDCNAQPSAGKIPQGNKMLYCMKALC
jgi:hypothetical protein